MRPFCSLAVLVATALSPLLTMHAAPSQAASAQALPATCTATRDQVRRPTLGMVGLTADGRLICFREDAPRSATSIGFVSGLVTDTALVGIDYRIQDGRLYGVGNAGGVYTLSTDTAAATLVNRLSVALDGTAFGVDFNPAADRLRIIGNTGQNLRHNVNAGGVTLVDTALAYTPGTPAPSLTGAAYTNNDLDAATATAIFDLDTALDQVVLQSPANAGTLAATGKLGLDARPAAGMDIHSTVRNGVTVANDAYAVLTPASGGSALYAIESLTGKASAIGAFAAENNVVDLAIPQGQL